MVWRKRDSVEGRGCIGQCLDSRAEPRGGRDHHSRSPGHQESAGAGVRGDMGGGPKTRLGEQKEGAPLSVDEVRFSFQPLHVCDVSHHEIGTIGHPAAMDP